MALHLGMELLSTVALVNQRFHDILPIRVGKD